MDATQPSQPGDKALLMPISRTVCRYFARGNCSRGDDCHFVHDSVLSYAERPVCVFFLKGNCYKGDKCNFRHDGEAQLDDDGQFSQRDRLSGRLFTSTVDRIYHGVRAVFGPGVEVSDVNLVDQGRASASLEVPRLVISWQPTQTVLHLGFNRLVDADEAMSDFENVPRFRHAACEISDAGAEHFLSHLGFKYTLTIHGLPDGFGDNNHDLDVVAELSEQWHSEHSEFEMVEPVFEEIQEFFYHNLPEYDKVEYIRFTSSARNTRSAVIVQYKSFAGVRTAQGHISHAIDISPHRRIAVKSRVIYGVDLTVRGPVMAVLEDNYEDLEQDIIFSGVSIRRSPIDKVRGVCVIKLSGPDKEEVRLSQQALRRLFSGAIAMKTKDVLWHPHFATPSGVKSINDVGRNANTFIYRDLDARCLRVYGTASAQATALASLIGELKRLQDRRIDLVIKANEFPTDYNEILKYLLDIYGSSLVKVQCAAGHRQTIFNGLPDEIAAVKTYISKFHRSIEAIEQSSTCPICWDTPSDPILLTCGHAYCHDCLTAQVQADQFPMTCHGTTLSMGGTDRELCAVSISLDLLQSAVGLGEAFEQVLRRALVIHMRERPTEFSSCPTADCGFYFKPITDPAFDKAKVQSENDLDDLFVCPGCSQSTCRACGMASHLEISCEEAEEWARDGDKAFARWRKRNHVRACPQCKAPIEKDGGCNHVTCIVCKTHICWFCMKTFTEADEVYTHMEYDHSDRDMNSDVEDSDEENGYSEDDDDDVEAQAGDIAEERRDDVEMNPVLDGDGADEELSGNEADDEDVQNGWAVLLHSEGMI